MRNNSKERRDERRAAATERQTAREALGDAGQLKKLIKQGFADCKEARRLRKRLQQPETTEEE